MTEHCHDIRSAQYWLLRWMHELRTIYMVSRQAQGAGFIVVNRRKPARVIELEAARDFLSRNPIPVLDGVHINFQGGTPVMTNEELIKRIEYARMNGQYLAPDETGALLDEKVKLERLVADMTAAQVRLEGKTLKLEADKAALIEALQAVRTLAPSSDLSYAWGRINELCDKALAEVTA